MKQEAKWRYNIYKGFLAFVQNGAGEGSFDVESIGMCTIIAVTLPLCNVVTIFLSHIYATGGNNDYDPDFGDSKRGYDRVDAYDQWIDKKVSSSNNWVEEDIDNFDDDDDDDDDGRSWFAEDDDDEVVSVESNRRSRDSSLGAIQTPRQSGGQYVDKRPLSPQGSEGRRTSRPTRSRSYLSEGETDEV